MITPRNVRRALLRACPVSLVGLIGGLAIGIPFAEAVALALFGAAPAPMLWLELWAQSWPDPTTRRSQIKLALLGWVLAFAVLLVLVFQGVYAHAKLAGQDPLTALTSFGPPAQDRWILPWLCGFAALSLAASTCVLVNLQHRAASMSMLASPDPRSASERASLAGIAVLGAGWFLLLVAPLLAAGPGGLSGKETLGFLLLFGVSSGVAIAFATPTVAALCVIADGLEEWLWPREATA